MSSIPPPSPQSILVIRRDNIGDLVCTTPLFTALRHRFPHAKIAALVNTYNADVLQGNPDVDHLFVYQKLKHAAGILQRIKAICKRLALIAELRRFQPEVTILAKAGYDRHGLNFAKQFGARQIIGFAPDETDAAKKLPDIGLSAPEFSKFHEVEAVFQLLEPLGIDAKADPLKLFPNAQAAESIRKRLPFAPTRIALHISARELERRWGVDNFTTLAEYILRTYPQAQIMLFWAPGKADDPHHPGDDEAASALMAAVSSDRLVPVPTQNLPELIAALSLCDLFIGADGGALHLAVGLNKPCVALFENLPSKLKHWYPWQVPNRVVHGDKPEVASIKVVQVVAALDALEVALKGAS